MEPFRSRIGSLAVSVVGGKIFKEHDVLHGVVFDLRVGRCEHGFRGHYGLDQLQNGLVDRLLMILVTVRQRSKLSATSAAGVWARGTA